MFGAADSYPFRTQPAPLRFGVAFAALAAVWLIDRAAGTVVDIGSHFLLLGMAVMATAWLAGTGPALATTVAGAILGATGTPSTQPSGDAMHLAIFVGQGLLLTALVSELRRARRVAEHQARVADAARTEAVVANRMKDEFLATVSHELRTPLNAVLGWVHLLRTGKLDVATSRRGLESIDRNVRLQAQVTADLLDVSKALTGKLQVDSRPILVADAARQALASVAAPARARDVQIRPTIANPSAMMLGDTARVRQIIWQLLSNAIKFTARGGAVDLVVEQTNEDVRIVVRDSGQGIDPAFLPRIFERFTQADGSPTRAAGGLGVGLALVRELAELQGGEVSAANREDAPGAVFTVRFPRYSGDVREAASDVIPIAASAPLDGLRVLVLDKDQEGSDLVKTVLQQRGAIVQTVTSVADALEALEGWHPDVLVSDAQSPDHDSYAIVGRVQSLDADRGGRIPAVALTNAARLDQRLRRILAPVQRRVPKPVEPATLTAEVARLSGRERRRTQR